IDTTALFSEPGIYVFELTANDGWLSSSSQVTVIVGAEPNVAPSVEAGADQTITLPDNTSLLNGTVTDDGHPVDPGRLTVTWKQIYGEGTAVFTDASQADTAVHFSGPGIYVFELRAYDGQLGSSDEITITVKPAPVPEPEPVPEPDPEPEPEPGPVELTAVIDIKPDTLCPWNRMNYLTVYIELPSGYGVEKIEIEAVNITAMNGIPAGPVCVLEKFGERGDYDRDGREDLMVKFPADKVKEIIPSNTREVKITIEGNLLDGTHFSGNDVVKILHPDREERERMIIKKLADIRDKIEELRHLFKRGCDIRDRRKNLAGWLEEILEDIKEARDDKRDEWRKHTEILRTDIDGIDRDFRDKTEEKIKEKLEETRKKVEDKKDGFLEKISGDKNKESEKESKHDSKERES
ncbi:MAG TPA: hypothetical protein VJC03_07185, partial [bacterium]|nr:hypothetical protein [bacterium]